MRSTEELMPCGDWPVVSVIVPTFNRASTLPYLLKALAEQVYPADRLELIVVDNSSTDQTESVVAQWTTVLPYLVTFYRKENRGPAASRNFGAARARGEFLAFTDSDCMPHPCWLMKGVSAFGPDVAIVCGAIAPVWFAGTQRLFAAQLEPVTRDTGLYPSANVFFRRSAFEVACGFDERFGLYAWGGLVHGEDTDLAWRIKRSGGQVQFVADAIVSHQATPLSVRAWLLRSLIVQILPRLLRSIPELRRTFLWKRYFASREHFYFAAAGVAVACAALTRSPIPLLAVLPWVASVRFPIVAELKRRRPFRATAIFVALVVYFTACVLTAAAASIRYRRVVI